MPRAAVRILVAIAGRSQCSVHPAAIEAGRAVVDGGADHGVAKVDRGPERDEPGALGFTCSLWGESEEGRRAFYERELARSFGCDEQEVQLRVVR